MDVGMWTSGCSSSSSNSDSNNTPPVASEPFVPTVYEATPEHRAAVRILSDANLNHHINPFRVAGETPEERRRTALYLGIYPPLMDENGWVFALQKTAERPEEYSPTVVVFCTILVMAALFMIGYLVSRAF